ncbi:hypothetical protein D3C78_1666060 [compost metagenome]
MAEKTLQRHVAQLLVYQHEAGQGLARLRETAFYRQPFVGIAEMGVGHGLLLVVSSWWNRTCEKQARGGELMKKAGDRQRDGCRHRL